MATERGETDAESALEDKVDIIAAATSKQMWLAILFIPLMLSVLAAGIISLSVGVKKIDFLLAIKPESRVEAFSADIRKVQKKVEGQYAAHLNKMDDESIFTVSRKFELLYEYSLDSESDYLKFLEGYQKATYEVTKKVRGSGEWYYYYDKKLMRLVKSSRRRLTLMKRYFEEGR